MYTVIHVDGCFMTLDNIVLLSQVNDEHEKFEWIICTNGFIMVPLIAQVCKSVSQICFADCFFSENVVEHL